MVQLRVPVTTYRLQFNREFRFEDARRIVPYLYRLGVSDLYASPLLKARSGSTHGYDVTDPTSLNTELGTREDFDRLVMELESRGMGLVLDIVPNHMAATTENPWWMDVLEHGKDSPYAAFFDIEWSAPGSAIEDRLLLPVLGSPYGMALENQELAIKQEDAALYLYYYDHRLPLNALAHWRVISHRLDALEETIGRDSPVVQRLKQIEGEIATSPYSRSLKEELLDMVRTSPEVSKYVSDNIVIINGRRGDPDSFDILDGLLGQQAYRLAHWRSASESLNYRRFFDISDLAGSTRLKNAA